MRPRFLVEVKKGPDYSHGPPKDTKEPDVPLYLFLLIFVKFTRQTKNSPSAGWRRAVFVRFLIRDSQFSSEELHLDHHW